MVRLGRASANGWIETGICELLACRDSLMVADPACCFRHMDGFLPALAANLAEKADARQYRQGPFGHLVKVGCSPVRVAGEGVA